MLALGLKLSSLFLGCSSHYANRTRGCTDRLSFQETYEHPDSLDALAIRAYGLLAIAALGHVKRNPGPIQITLKIDPSKLYPEWPGHEEFEQRTFPDWAKDFADYEAQAHDLELLANMRQMEYNDLVSWVDQRFSHTSAGLDRGIELLKLTIRMYQQSIEARRDDGSLIWIILVRLALSSITDLVRKVQ